MNNAGLSDSQIVGKIRGHQTITRICRLFSIIGYLGIICLPLGLLFKVAMGDRKIWTIMIIAGAVGIPVALIGAKIGNSLSVKLKAFIGEYVVKGVVAERIDITQYTPISKTTNDIIKKCTLLPRYDRITVSDYIKGTYKQVPITYCDLHLEQEETDTDDEGHTSTTYRTVFKGHLINLGLGQKIDGFVKIKERKNPRKEKGFLSNVFSGAADILGIKTKDETIEVENEAFNNQFEIRTSNQQMSFYILTPQFMENIIRADSYACGYTNIEFRGQNAFIALNTGRDSFEITKTVISKKSLDNSRQQMRGELNRILAVVDEILAKDNLF